MPKKNMHGAAVKTPEEALQETEIEIQNQLDLLWRMIAQRQPAEKVNVEGIALRCLLTRWNDQMNRYKLEGNLERAYFTGKEARDALA